jgi:cellulose synthase/poly-beta-1,6-N-acetylglucosamine synthase-like glycosyltransferase
VIEDTGSTIDLIRNGWRVHNYPQRLAYSATPPDFGSLIIQRRRWSNGGLIILPDLLRHCIAAWPSRGVLSEAMMRVHYLLSPALGSVGMLLLMLIPFDPLVSSTQQTASSIWLPLLAAPYFLLYGRDLVRSGYEWRDLGRVYARNLILLPVQLAGVLLSVRQILTGTKAPFGRTPKVEDRTAMAPIYPLFNIVMFAVVLVFALYSLLHGNYFQAGLWTFNVVAYAYAFGAMIGVAAACEDIRTGFGERLKGLRQSDWVGAASLGQIAKSLRRRKHAREQLALARARGSQD